MKNFRLEVPEGQTDCLNCPFNAFLDPQETSKLDVCKWLAENDICEEYDFTKFHLWDDLNN